MALGVLNNISAVYAENNLNQTQASLQNVLQQLSSGSRINSGADDAAGLSIANGLQANSSALTQSSSNASAGVGFLQVADGALSQVTNLLNRAVTLATEAGGGTLSSSQLSAANQEYQDILTQIGTIGTTTEYNGISVFSGTSGGASSAVTLTAAAKTVTSGGITAGNTLSGSVVLDDAIAGKTSSLTMSDYSGLTTASTEVATLASLNTKLTTDMGGLVSASYSGGVLTFTDTTNNLTSAGALNQVTPVTGGVNIYTSDGTSAGSYNYGVTVGVLTNSSVGTSASGSAAGTSISATVGGVASTANGTSAGAGVGSDLSATQLDGQPDAEAALQTVTNAINAVAYQRGQVGANINTLTAASNIASAEQTNVSSAQNTITATDYAAATSNMSKFEILTQTGISALAQANSTEQMVTKLLQ
ncbi:MAG TPA: flagellin [Acidobacteriaceae bacterium]|jgi:flagellin|nr:flagellin [Acidobacteriaceae bacterium]